MSFRILQLKDLDISFKQSDDDITLSFAGAHIKKTMDDAEDKTLWSQDGSIEFRKIDNLEVYQILNEKITSITISYDFYTYKNMLVLPFMKKGGLLIELKFGSIKEIINFKCREMEIILNGDPKYIRHIAKTE
ncbi:hypothetical protein N9A44_00580 [Gammaproteobacteria bacterium]|nr:hypothetical protein [Gammaproteobacteria bacterium]